MAERKAVTKQMARRYAKASKTEKGLMLDELCALTEWTRRHARRALRQALSGAPEAPPQTQGEDLRTGCHPSPPGGVGHDERAGRQAPGPVHGRDRRGPGAPRGATHGTGVRTKLLAMSSATIDRALAPERRRLRVKGRSGTKPGSITFTRSWPYRKNDN